MKCEFRFCCLVLVALSIACGEAMVQEEESQNEELTAEADTAGQQTALFDGESLEGWTATGKISAFSVRDESIYCDGTGGGILYYEPQTYKNFVLETEVKVSEEANSGIFFRLADPSDPVQTGIELQVLDSYGKEEVDTHDFGAIYDVQAPSANAARPPGEWNQIRLRCDGPRIEVELNGQQVIDMNLEEWTEAGKNPDGTPNKFNRPYQEMIHTGHIGFQDHGNPVWYRNVRIQRLN